MSQPSSRIDLIDALHKRFPGNSMTVWRRMTNDELLQFYEDFVQNHKEKSPSATKERNAA